MCAWALALRGDYRHLHFSTSFFARSFAQCYEEVPQETLEALRAMGAGRVKVFFSAVLPSAFTGMLAWTSISFESNFEASAVLGRRVAPGALDM